LGATESALEEIQTRREGWRALSRGLICGYVDSYTLLTLGVYTSFMSGNTTASGMYGGQAKISAAITRLLPVPFFVAGTFIGALLRKDKRQNARACVSLLIATLLAFDIVATYLHTPRWLCIIVLSIAMGIMNTTLSHIGAETVGLGFVTGDLKRIGEHLADIVTRAPVPQAQGPWDTHRRRAAILAGIWFSFLMGAVCAAALELHLGVWTLLIPGLLLVALSLTEHPLSLDHHEDDQLARGSRMT